MLYQKSKWTLTLFMNYSQNGPNPKRPRTKRPKSETAQDKTAQLFWSKRPNFCFLSEMGLVCEFQEFIFQKPNTPSPPPPPHPVETILKLFHIPVPLPYYTLKIRFRTNYYCIDMKHWTLHIR